jgi:hypothetical protein
MRQARSRSSPGVFSDRTAFAASTFQEDVVSKPSALRAFFPAIAIVGISIAAVSIVAIAMVAIAGGAPAVSAGPAVARGNWAASPVRTTPTPAATARIQARYAALPLAFEANQGQADAQVKYVGRGEGYRLLLTSSHAVMTLSNKRRFSEVLDMMMTKRRGLAATRALMKQREQQRLQESTAVLRMNLLAPNSHAQLVPEDLQEGKVNYFIGRDRSKWHSNIPLYGRVSYRGVFPGVDLAFHGNGKQLEFDYLVSAGADASAIALNIEGADGMQTSDAGDLILSTNAGPVELHKPVAYQTKDGAREAVDARFVLNKKNEIAFALGAYDHNRELVIDPVVTYSTYFGGNAEDFGISIAIDSSGDAYIAGATDSATIPAPNNTTVAPDDGGFDTFVTEISPSGTCLLTTFFGGSSDDIPGAIAVDRNGIYVAGTTDSDDFPTPDPTGASAQNSYSGVGPHGGNVGYAVNLALSNGALVWGTYIEGVNSPDSTSGLGLAVDGGDNFYVVGETFSSDLGGGSTNGSVINLGSGSGDDDGYLVKVSSDGTTFLFVGFIGGSSGDLATDVALDGSGNIHISGITISTDLPVIPNPGVVQTQCSKCSGGVDDAFAASIKTNLSGYNYLTYYGGSKTDDALAIASDTAGDAFLTGDTQSSDFPTAGTPYQGSLATGATQNAFVVELNPTASAALESTYFGGNGTDFGLGIALDNSSPPNVYLTGQTSSSNFPTSVNAIQPALVAGANTDAFVSALNLSQGSLLYSSYLGGGGDSDQFEGSIGLDSSQNMYVTGDTDSGNGSTAPFPTTNALDGTYGGGGTCAVFDLSGPCTDAFIAAFTPATAPDYGLSASAPAAVSPGTSATTTITLTAVNGYSSSVNLTCGVTGSGSPLPACGTFSTNPQTPGAPPGATSTLTITTGTSTALAGSSKIFYAMWLPIVGLSLAGMCFTTTGSRRKKLLGFIILGAVMAMLFFLPACGGSSSTTPTGCTGCTPAGSYTVTITGTGTDTNHIVHSTQVTLTVN